jgi:hypothetical protein
MSTKSSVYLGFIDGNSRHTRNMASIAWVIYSPEGQLVSSSGVLMEPLTNKVAKYITVIDLLRDAISHGVRSL